MNTKTILSILGVILVIVAIVLLSRGNKDLVTPEDTLNQQTMLEGTQGDAISPEDLAAQVTPVTPATIPPTTSEEVEAGQQPAPSFPQTGFPETE